MDQIGHAGSVVPGRLGLLCWSIASTTISISAVMDNLLSESKLVPERRRCAVQGKSNGKRFIGDVAPCSVAQIDPT